MSTSTEGLFAFQWDLADRLAKTLRVADMSASEMADHLEVHRNTVGSWLRGQTTPNAAVLRVWAIRTGAQYQWLRYGVEPEDGPPGGGQPGNPNQGTSDYKAVVCQLPVGIRRPTSGKVAC